MQIIIDAVADDDGCSVVITGEASTGTPEEPSGSFCFIDVTAADKSVVSDAMTSLTVDLAAEACVGASSVLTLEATAVVRLSNPPPPPPGGTPVT